MRRDFLKKMAAAGAVVATGSSSLLQAAYPESTERWMPALFRTDAESFDRDMPIRFLPIKFDKLRLKLEAAKRANYHKAITFEFSHFMSPQSAYLQAGHQYDRYKDYFNIS